MIKELVTRDALDAYSTVLRCFKSARQRHNHNFEIQDVVLHINSRSTVGLRAFLDLLIEKEPLRLGKGLRKAERAYTRNGDRITKPSYIRRVRSFIDFSRKTRSLSDIDQIKTVARGFCKEPNASYHIISVFRPVDLLDKFRPGYVPCVICADFKYRNKKLIAKFFFRSCGAYNLLPFDIFYCTDIVEQLKEEIMRNNFPEDIKIDRIMFWFSRIYISRFDIDHRSSMIKKIYDYRNGVAAEDKQQPVKTVVSKIRRRAPSIKDRPNWATPTE
jgi:hypothetical protein